MIYPMMKRSSWDRLQRRQERYFLLAGRASGFPAVEYVMRTVRVSPGAP